MSSAEMVLERGSPIDMSYMDVSVLMHEPNCKPFYFAAIKVETVLIVPLVGLSR